MKNINLNRLTTLGCCIALLAAASVTNIFGQSNSITSILPVSVISNSSVVPASGSMLVRKDNGVFATVTTSGLVPGTAATMWIALYNTPAACATSPCTPADLNNPSTHAGLFNGGGRIVGNDGTATFSVFRAVGDETGREGGTRGLIFPLTAEIHLVVRTHGAANLTDPTILSQQLSLFNGGCPPNTCTSIQISRFLP